MVSYKSMAHMACTDNTSSCGEMERRREDGRMSTPPVCLGLDAGGQSVAAARTQHRSHDVRPHCHFPVNTCHGHLVLSSQRHIFNNNY